MLISYDAEPCARTRRQAQQAERGAIIAGPTVLILLASTTVEYEIRVMFIYTTTSWEYSYSTLPYYERSMNTTLASSSKYH